MEKLYHNTMIKAALNSVRDAKENKGVPVTTTSIVIAAKESILAGAAAIHFHVRDDEGNETLAPKFVAEQMAALKEALPNTPIGISTGEWIEPDIIKRRSLIKGWQLCPDFVSLNFSEEGYRSIADILIAKNIGIEAGISSATDALELLQSGLLKNCFRILIEPQGQNIDEATETIYQVEQLLKGKLDGQRILLHGFDDTAWQIFSMALDKGYETRMGFEDTIYLPSGVLAKSNASLIAEAVQIEKIKWGS